MLSIAYYIAFFFSALAFLMNVIHRKAFEFVSALAALIAGLCSLIIITWNTGHLPVFGSFESLMLVSFTLMVPCLFFKGADGQDEGFKKIVWAEILLLFFIMLFIPKTPPPDQFDHDDLYIVSFFGFRMLALGVMLFSSAQFIRAAGVTEKRHEYTR